MSMLSPVTACIKNLVTGNSDPISSASPMPSMDYWLQHAVDVIYSTYGDQVSVYNKNKDLLKFGRSEAVGTGAAATLEHHLSGVLNETFSTTNDITHISSSSGSDTVEIKIEGQTVDASGNFTFVVQTKTLVGQTKTALDTPIARCTRLYNNDTGTAPNNGAALVGTVYVYTDVTVTSGVPASDVHCMIVAGKQNSEKASTTISNDDYWIITGAYADILEKSTVNAEVSFEVRLKGGVFREYFEMSCSNSSGAFRSSVPYIIIPPNSDVRLTAIASSANTTVSGGMLGALASIIT